MIAVPDNIRRRTVPPHDEAAGIGGEMISPVSSDYRKNIMTSSAYGGFTVLETLVALCILAIVLTTVYTSYTGTLKIINEADYGDEIYSMARITMKRMTEDLQALIQYKDSFIFVSQIDEDGANSFARIFFLSSAHLCFDGENSPDTAMISYFVRKDDESDGYALMREDIPYKGAPYEAENRAGGIMLCDRLAALSYTFYDTNGSRYDTWDSDSEIHNHGAPSMVAVRLDFVNPDDEDKPLRFMTNIYIPTAGSL